jgi:hypothetical protein
VCSCAHTLLLLLLLLLLEASCGVTADIAVFRAIWGGAFWKQMMLVGREI